MFQLQCSAVCYRIRCYLAPFCCSNLNSNITLLVTEEEQMAPRGRSRAGNTRMDAAIDALTPMGFSPPQIRRKVKDLLEVYGGREGWAFIEEASYKLLIETLLEDQDSEKPEEPKLLEYRASETAGEPLFEKPQSLDYLIWLLDHLALNKAVCTQVLKLRRLSPLLIQLLQPRILACSKTSQKLTWQTYRGKLH